MLQYPFTAPIESTSEVRIVKCLPKLFFRNLESAMFRSSSGRLSQVMATVPPAGHVHSEVALGVCSAGCVLSK